MTLIFSRGRSFGCSLGAIICSNSPLVVYQISVNSTNLSVLARQSEMVVMSNMVTNMYCEEVILQREISILLKALPWLSMVSMY